MAHSLHILLCFWFAVSLVVWRSQAETVTNIFYTNQPISGEQKTRTVECAVQQIESNDKYFEVDACIRVDGHHHDTLTIERDLDECASSPCVAGSTCEDKVNGYSCHCAAGTTGVHCEIDPCSPSPCQNGGTCNPSADGSSYTCSCVTLVTGANCETGPEWIMNAGRYYYSSTSMCTYADCRSICLGLSADLITIESDMEQAFAASIATGNFWMSIYESAEKAPGRWVLNPDSNQVITYTNWYSGQDNYPSQRCAAGWKDVGYRWYDDPCTWNRYYICEK